MKYKADLKFKDGNYPKQVEKQHRIRSLVIAVFFFLSVNLIFLKLASLQIFDREALVKRGDRQHKTCLTVEARRGDIFDRKFRILATNVEMKSIYGVPYEIDNALRTAQQLAAILDISSEKIERRLSSNKKFVWIKRKVSDEIYTQIHALQLKGIYALEESKRFYPKGELASHVLGFVDIDNKGIDGAELSLDRYLQGETGYRFVERDATGRAIMSLIQKDVLPQNGASVILTIDEVIQYIVEAELEKAYKKYNAQGATVIVMDPYRGEILALANRPTYNPNKFFSCSADDRRNRALTDFFEPGSIFKVLVGAAALNEQIVNLEEEFFCEHGAYAIGKRVLHDSHPYDTLTFRQVIEKSSNIGMAKVAYRLGKDKLYDYISNFGFGKETSLGLRGEARGIVHQPEQWSKIQTANISMGQGVSVTAIQMVNAMSAIANGGTLVRPRVIKRITAENGTVIFEDKIDSEKRVISREVAKQITEALKGVVSERGTARQAAIDGFEVAGKTGTAQKVKPTGGYSHSDFVASFVGFVPADDPVIAMLVVFDNPKPLYYGGVVAAPVFKEIAKAVLKYLGVSPQIAEEGKESLV